MKRFLNLIRENMDLRIRLEEQMTQVYEGFAAAGAAMDYASIEEAFMIPGRQAAADVTLKNLMGVAVPDFQFQNTGEGEGTFYPYGLAFTSADLDRSVETMQKVMPLMLRLAQAEKTGQLMAEEIEKTRRKVNALEYVQIPALQETIKRIAMKLDENERSNLARLMKIKDMMLAR